MPSSVVASIDYSASSRSLYITYVSGIIYEYKNVPAEVHKALTIAGSKGRYLNHHIKGKYEFEKIDVD